MNICPRQEIPILDIYPDWKTKDVPAMKKELGSFSRFLQVFALDEYAANTPRETESKEEMRENSMRSQDKFAHALLTGDLLFFCEVLSLPIGLQNAEHMRAAQNLCKTQLREYKAGEVAKIFNYELLSCYEALIGKSGSSVKFGVMLNRLGVKTVRTSRGDTRSRGIELVWTINETDRQLLINKFCAPSQFEQPLLEQRALPE